MDEKSKDRLIWDFKLEGLVSAVDSIGKPLMLNGYPITNLKIGGLKKVNIGDMVRNPYISLGSFKLLLK